MTRTKKPDAPPEGLRPAPSVTRRVAFAADTSDAVAQRFTTRGVVLTVMLGTLTAGACPHQSFLAVATMPLPPHECPTATTAIVPPAAVAAAKKALDDEPERCRLTLTPTMFRLETDRVAIASALLAGRPLPLAEALRRSLAACDRTAGVACGELLGAFRRIAAVADDGEARRVACAWGSTLRLSVTSSPKGSGSVELPLPAWDGVPCTTDLCPDYVAQVMAQVATDSSPATPVAVRLGGADKALVFAIESGWHCLLMPMVS